MSFHKIIILITISIAFLCHFTFINTQHFLVSQKKSLKDIHEVHCDVMQHWIPSPNLPLNGRLSSLRKEYALSQPTLTFAQKKKKKNPLYFLYHQSKANLEARASTQNSKS